MDGADLQHQVMTSEIDWIILALRNGALVIGRLVVSVQKIRMVKQGPGIRCGLEPSSSIPNPAQPTDSFYQFHHCRGAVMFSPHHGELHDGKLTDQRAESHAFQEMFPGR